MKGRDKKGRRICMPSPQKNPAGAHGIVSKLFTGIKTTMM